MRPPDVSPVISGHELLLVEHFLFHFTDTLFFITTTDFILGIKIIHIWQ